MYVFIRLTRQQQRPPRRPAPGLHQVDRQRPDLDRADGPRHLPAARQPDRDLQRQDQLPAGPGRPEGADPPGLDPGRRRPGQPRARRLHPQHLLRLPRSRRTITCTTSPGATSAPASTTPRARCTARRSTPAARTAPTRPATRSPSATTTTASPLILFGHYHERADGGAPGGHRLDGQGGHARDRRAAGHQPHRPARRSRPSAPPAAPASSTAPPTAAPPGSVETTITAPHPVGRCHVIDNHHPDVKVFMEQNTAAAATPRPRRSPPVSLRLIQARAGAE